MCPWTRKILAIHKNDSTLLVCTMCVNIFGVMFLLLHTQQLLRGFKIYLFHLQNRNWRKKRMNTNREEVVVHWFRHGLRLHDNPSLIDGLSECDRFYPVFIFDGEVAGNLLFFFEKRFIAELNFQGRFFFLLFQNNCDQGSIWIVFNMTNDLKVWFAYRYCNDFASLRDCCLSFRN